MHTVTRFVAKLMLRLLGLIIPVFIAACYGAPYGYGNSGRVIDRKTRTGIGGIKVTCWLAGAEDSSTYSTANGYYDFYSACDEIRAEDVDGAANGSYQPATIPGCQADTGCDLTIEMDPVE